MYHMTFCDEELLFEAERYLKEEFLQYFEKKPLSTDPEALKSLAMLPPALLAVITAWTKGELVHDADPCFYGESIGSYLVYTILQHFEEGHRGINVSAQKELFWQNMNKPSFKNSLPNKIYQLFYRAYTLLPNKPLGARATVTVDRPLGSRHPSYPDLVYPVNYGYVKGVTAPDGEEQDAYILGVSEPIEEFEGVIIAVIERKNDVEDKWVVAPKGISFSKDEILKAVHFQEGYFETILHTISI